MNKENLTKLANFLIDKYGDSDSPAFNMSSWSQSCGTVHCAVGDAAASGLFEGLAFPEMVGTVPALAMKPETYSPYTKAINLKEDYGSKIRFTYGYQSVMALFDITFAEAVTLFASDSYRSDARAIEVAYNIVDHINTRPVFKEGTRFEARSPHKGEITLADRVYDLDNGGWIEKWICLADGVEEIFDSIEQAINFFWFYNGAVILAGNRYVRT